MRPTCLLALLPLPLAGCATTSDIKFPSQPVTIADLVQEIKHEVAEFERQKGTLPTVQSLCGQALQITTKKVAVTVTTVTKRTTDGSLSAEIPLGAGSLGPSAGASRGFTGTQTVGFTIYPQTIAAGQQAAPQSPKFEGTPLTDALMSVYSGLRANAQYAPCVTFGDVEKQENAIGYGFKVEQSRTLGGKVKLFVFSLGASDKRENSVDNTIKLSFTLSGGAVMLRGQ